MGQRRLRFSLDAKFAACNLFRHPVGDAQRGGTSLNPLQHICQLGHNILLFEVHGNENDEAAIVYRGAT